MSKIKISLVILLGIPFILSSCSLKFTGDNQIQGEQALEGKSMENSPDLYIIKEEPTVESSTLIVPEAAVTSSSEIYPDCSVWPDKLQYCVKYKCQYIHPFTQEVMTREISGFSGDLCVYKENMPGGFVMTCQFPHNLRLDVADYYRSIDEDAIISVEGKVSFSESQVTYLAPGVTVNGSSQVATGSTLRFLEDQTETANPMERALNGGICQISL